MTETLIRIEELHKSFGKNEVLKGINLEIKRGEVVVIIGPSGSGKSTLLRSMNLLEEASKGKVIFEGVDITDKKNEVNSSVFEVYVPKKDVLRGLDQDLVSRELVKTSVEDVKGDKIKVGSLDELTDNGNWPTSYDAKIAKQ